MPSKKPTAPKAREMHKRCGVIMSAPRVKRRVRQTVGRKTRMSGASGLCVASIAQSVLEQLLREAGSHVPKGKDLIKPIHIAKALADRTSVVHGVLPSKVAGVYTKSY